jgi:hypothetical protein
MPVSNHSGHVIQIQIKLLQRIMETNPIHILHIHVLSCILALGSSQHRQQPIFKLSLFAILLYKLLMRPILIKKSENTDHLLPTAVNLELLLCYMQFHIMQLYF